MHELAVTQFRQVMRPWKRTRTIFFVAIVMHSTDTDVFNFDSLISQVL
jgi:hypothetical protein